MKILSIETSCDETAVSFVEGAGKAGAEETLRFKVLGNVVLTQIPLHKEYGGVYPSLAKREHAKNIMSVFLECLEQADEVREKTQETTEDAAIKARLEKLLVREPELLEQFLQVIPTLARPNIDAVAVTHGPGLEPALWVGINFAKALALVWNLPVIPVNHMEGHALSALLQEKSDAEGWRKFHNISYPALLLLVSGGHTELVLIQKPLQYKLLGATRDDAAGEAFDKTARLLELPYPGGPEIARLAETCTSTPRFSLPRPMVHSGDFDFSFSGLKTSVLYTLRNIPEKTPELKAEMAKAIEDAITETLAQKTRQALTREAAQTLILGGGVTANKKIRKTFEDMSRELNFDLLVPSMELTTDNALMIALAGYLRATDNPENLKQTPEAIENIHADGSLDLVE